MAKDLTVRVHDLPAEIFNQIREEVLSFKVTAAIEYIHITSAYRFPELLQVDQISREKLTKTYYSNKVFIFETMDMAGYFLYVMGSQIMGLVNGIRFYVEDEHEVEGREFFPLLSCIFNLREKQGIEFYLEMTDAKALVEAGEPFDDDSPEQKVVLFRNESLAN